MKWKTFEPGPAEVSDDGLYAVHYVVNTWTAWQRNPLKRIGRNFHRIQYAKEACEQDATEKV